MCTSLGKALLLFSGIIPQRSQGTMYMRSLKTENRFIIVLDGYTPKY